jgi:hypothetical protein
MVHRTDDVEMDNCGNSKEPLAQPRRRGPVEDAKWPEVLQARVMTPGPRASIHGYDVEEDLARFYGWADVVLLALTAELPSVEAATAFGVIATFLAPVGVEHASVHAPVLGRLCGAPTSAIVGVAAIALAEQTRKLLDEHVELLQWCSTLDGELPERYRATDAPNIDSVNRFTSALGPSGLHVVGLDQSPTRAAAMILALSACGLRRREQLEAAVTYCRLPTTIAEALAEHATNFATYPMDLPRFELMVDA